MPDGMRSSRSTLLRREGASGYESSGHYTDKHDRCRPAGRPMCRESQSLNKRMQSGFVKVECVANNRRGRLCPSTLMAASLAITAPALLAQQSALQESGIQQILKANCQPCHNDTTKSSGLALTARESILAGGNRGAAITSGRPDESLLVRAIEQS